MNIEKTNADGITIFALDGKLDAVSAPQLHTELLEELNTVKNVTLDCAKLTYLSSAGLRVLLAGDKTTKSLGCKMTLKGVSDKIMEILVMTGFEKILTFEK
ncbi:MAG: STAS domain-containing protein [Synergistaceae bacterium]|jgi:anti-sigma B factor antagonist|nr:STAS domain-containing protein [Synergistaceae bacterium]